MPGTETVRKRTSIGGAIGIAVLALALVYRFYPDQAPRQSLPQLQTREPPTETTWVAQRRAQENEESAVFAPGDEQAGLVDIGPVGPPIAVSEEVGELLAQGEAAEEAGRLLEPDDDSALALYRQVLEIDGSNTQARAALRRIGAVVRDRALAAVERADKEEAQRYTTLLHGLPHASAEMEQLEERLLVLREVMPLLARAAELLREGRESGSGKNNALAVYHQVLALDPNNSLADEGLAQIERRQLGQALDAAARDDFERADSLLAEAATIRPGSQSLLETRGRVEGIRGQRAQSVLSQARSALDANNADLAEELAQRAQAISPDLSGLDEFSVRLRNARLYASLSPGQVVEDRYLDRTGQAPPMVVIPAGSFIMGSPGDEPGRSRTEEPRRRVQIAVGFALGQSEVTVGQFREFVRASGHVSEAERIGTGSYYDEKTGRMAERRGISWRDDYHGERAADELPVINVSWNDAQAYTEWLTQRTGKPYRLPSEAEMEYAVRAGSTTRYPWGDDAPEQLLENVTGEGDRSRAKRSWARFFPRYNDGHWGPAPVRSFQANAFGLYDMAGNVSEWTHDCWHDNYVRAPRSSAAWVNPGCELRVVRGGSWGSDPDQVRSAFRVAASATTRSARVGFRIARDLLDKSDDK